VHAAIVGTRNPEHIASAVEAAGRSLGERELAEIDSIMEPGVQFEPLDPD
jgi:aryl-alcohol dehydrogenase-like predicted oxidoreductase